MAYKHDRLSFEKLVPVDDAPSYLGEVVSVLNALPREITPLAIKSQKYSFPIIRQGITGRDISEIKEEPVQVTRDDVYKIAQEALRSEGPDIKNLVYFELGKFEEPPFVSGILSEFQQTMYTESKEPEKSIISRLVPMPLLFPPKLLASENACFYILTQLMDEWHSVLDLKENLTNAMQKAGYHKHKSF